MSKKGYVLLTQFKLAKNDFLLFRLIPRPWRPKFAPEWARSEWLRLLNWPLACRHQRKESKHLQHPSRAWRLQGLAEVAVTLSISAASADPSKNLNSRITSLSLNLSISTKHSSPSLSDRQSTPSPSHSTLLNQTSLKTRAHFYPHNSKVLLMWMQSVSVKIQISKKEEIWKVDLKKINWLWLLLSPGAASIVLPRHRESKSQAFKASSLARVSTIIPSPSAPSTARKPCS